MAAVGEVAVLRLGGGEPGDQLVAEVLRFDDRVDHQVGREPEDVDVGLVLLAELGDVLDPLEFATFESWRPAS